MNHRLLWVITIFWLGMCIPQSHAGVLFKRDNADPHQFVGFSAASGQMAAVEFDSSTDPGFSQANQITIQAVRFFVKNLGPSDVFKVRVLRQAGESDADLTRPTKAFTDQARALAEKSVVVSPAPETGSFPGFTDWVTFDNNGVVVTTCSYGPDRYPEYSANQYAARYIRQSHTDQSDQYDHDPFGSGGAHVRQNAVLRRQRDGGLPDGIVLHRLLQYPVRA